MSIFDTIDICSMINISRKEDIVIPSSKIEDEGWTDKAEYIARSLLYSWGTSIDNIKFDLKTEEELDNLESRIETTLPKGLRLIFSDLGTPDVNQKLQEFDMVGRLNEMWDLDAQPYHGPDFSTEELALLPHLVTFSDHHGCGSVFCFHDETKEIYFFDTNGKPYFFKMFNSIDDYIKACLISCQIDLFDVEVGQAKVEKWIEEILIDSFGKEIYSKWDF